MTTDRTHPFAAADSAWLRMDHPTNVMNVTAVVMLRDPLDYARLLAVLEERFLVHERFRQRAQETPGQLGRPSWIRADGFRLEDHVPRVRLPEPADEHALQRLVGEIMSEPLDRERPLWQLHYVENFKAGAAIIARLHHCIADGVALVRVLLSLAQRENGEPYDLSEPLIPTAVRPPAGAVAYARALGSGLASLGKLATMRADPRTPLKGPLGQRKLATWSDPIPLADIKHLARHVEGTVNDVLLTAVAGALRRYVGRHGSVPRDLNLRAVVPVNLRSASDARRLGNRFGLVFLPLPVGLDRPLDRLRELKRRMDRIKQSAEAAVTFTLLRVFGSTAAAIQNAVVNLLGKNATAVMTNVPGPRHYLYFCGSRIDDLVFWVPQSGRLGLGVSIFSYVGQVRIGIATDEGLVADPETLVADFHAALAELAAGNAEAPAAAAGSAGR